MVETIRLMIDRLASPLGEIIVIFDEDSALRALDFADYEERMRRLLRLHQRADHRLAAAQAPPSIKHRLEAFFGGEVDAVDAIPVATGGTDFQRRVWAELRRIAAGTTTTYGRLAQTVGRPRASRAVGMANGSNPVSIVVPCHRVIGADATLTGYGGGLERKRWLIEHERKWTSRQNETPQEVKPWTVQ